ncbi:solute carrier family 35 member G1-like [Saccoglossus kowalevskii]|uniref:Uncharacterized protein LOC102808872 n=1 Tax=Saccoglossus kowalevskii TaxID=10224 RepID=A0ABM0MF31_SACKO|nr:PREDICTED: uncharacterized protein LOC102808872 [Saccoglossus kowalevskii]
MGLIVGAVLHNQAYLFHFESWHSHNKCRRTVNNLARRMENNSSTTCRYEKWELSDSAWLFRTNSTEAKCDIERVSEGRESTSCWMAFLGISLALLSGLFMGIADVFCVICVYAGLSPAQNLTIRSLAVATVIIPIMMCRRINPFNIKKRDIVLAVMKGSLENGADIMFYYTAVLRGIGDATAITTGAVMVFIPVIARIFVNEKLTVKDGITILVNIVGIILVTRPEFIFGPTQGGPILDTKHVALGYILALVTSLSLAIGVVCFKGLSDDISVLIVMFYSCLSGVLVNLPLIYFTSTAPIYTLISENIAIIGYLFAIVVLYIGYLYTFNTALQLEPAAKVALLCNFQVMVSFAAEVIVFHNVVTVLELVGAGLVLLSSCIVTILAWLSSENYNNAKKSSSIQ